MILMLKSAWLYRQFIFSSILTEKKSRFARSKLGGLWLFIHPLAQAAVLALVLSKILAAKFPGIDSEYAYAIYLLAGMLGWALFAEVIGRSLNIFTDNASLLKKINFPRICLPLILVGSALLDHLLLTLCTIGIYLAMGHIVGPYLWFLPILILVNVSFATGLGLLLGVMNVFIRDVGQAFVVILQFWFWMTPIVYSAELVPEQFETILRINPMFYVVRGYQGILAYRTAPPWAELGLFATVSALLLLVSLILFRRASSDLVDEL